MLTKINQYLRQATNWVEGFANKKYALWALFAVAFAESSFFPIPPDVLLIAISLLLPRRAFISALTCTIGSFLGGMLGYLIGYSFMETVGIKIINFYNAYEIWQKVVQTYNSEVGFWFLAGAAITPIPFKVATIAAGATQMSFLPFIIIAGIGRGLRFLFVGGLIYFFGPPVKLFIDKYFDKLAFLFLLLLIGGFFAIKFII
ncbi:MAG: YqaA family protein [Candidatus Kapaibacteriales bacterium]